MAASAKKKVRGKDYKSLAERLRRNPRRSTKNVIEASSPEVSENAADEEKRENIPALANTVGTIQKQTPVKRTSKRAINSISSSIQKEVLSEKKEIKEKEIAAKELPIIENLELEEELNSIKLERNKLLKTLKELEGHKAGEQAQKAARAALQVHLSWLQKRYDDLKASVHVQNILFEERCNMAIEEVLASNFQNFEMRKKNQVLSAELNELRAALKRSDVVRRELHEKVMSLRGGMMRVFCRLRPVTGNSNNGVRFQIVDNKQGERSQMLRVNTISGMSLDGSSSVNKNWEFRFDRVFSANETQSDLYLEVEALVQSVLDGYNVCIFAYGQTGSGKTHTMIGNNNNSENRGICPRAIDQLVQICNQKSYELRLSCLEIYNEGLVDLLSQFSSSEKEQPLAKRQRQSSASIKNKELNIRHDPILSKTSVENLTILSVKSSSEAQNFIDQALAARSVAKTNVNERSSRSHTVLSLYVESDTHSSVLHLVDLAGSERLAHSGSDKSSKLLKEQCAINSSLTALKKTLRSIKNKQAHVPYRDSKLTYLLQNAWQSESCKTLMIVTASQQAEFINESLNSLRFAEDMLEECSA